MRFNSKLAVLLAIPLLLLVGCQEDQDQLTAPPAPTSHGALKATGPLSGAIFTTTVDGAIVNENVRYEAKEDVYLDGGPGPNAPASAAGLPEGDYYFQVTDPSGKDLLSSDHISCRRIHVNADGVIDVVYSGFNYEYQNNAGTKTWEPVACQHEQGVDIDHAELGAITVQLYPYDDTPNNGGVYKVWITPVDQYLGDDGPIAPEAPKQTAVNGENWQPGNVHGFDPRWSKTDNYKVRKNGRPPCLESMLTVRKFHDANGNGVQDEGEEDVAGWGAEITDTGGVTNNFFTPVAEAIYVAGDYTVVEDTPDGTAQTAAFLDGVALAVAPTVVVTFASECEENHEVVYGNVGLGSVTACKVYDANGNGVADADEVGIEGFKFELSMLDEFGVYQLAATGYTGADGCVTFSDLMPGDYRINEVLPASGDWAATSALSYDFSVVSTLDGAAISGSDFEYTFTNICYGEADFGTKGYWHNKNGLQEIEQAFVTGYVNGLDPYDNPTGYFEDGDEPFDGVFADGTLVDAAFNDDGSPIWGAGTWQAEISLFLVDANAGGDPREQLAQQLLAFIFNAEYRLFGDGLILLPDGSWAMASGLVAEAIAAWQSGTAAEQDAIKSLLDTLNNSDALRFVYSTPCEVLYY